MSQEIEATLEVLVRKVERATGEREANSADIREVRALLAQLIDILGHRGDLNDGHRRMLAKLAKRARQPAKPVVKLSVIQDKYQAKSSDVDCAALLPLCEGRCCSFVVPLAEQDIREGGLEWEIRDPYILVRDSDGYCGYLERGSGRCTCYHQRPGVCREYDCRTDSRVWLDFDKRIPAPLPNHILALSKQMALRKA